MGAATGKAAVEAAADEATAATGEVAAQKAKNSSDQQ